MPDETYSKAFCPVTTGRTDRYLFYRINEAQNAEGPYLEKNHLIRRGYFYLFKVDQASAPAAR